MESYDFAAIRRMLEEAFNDDEFQQFCFDYFPKVKNKFTSGQTFGARVIELVDYAGRYGRIEDLLMAVKKENPYQYTRFESNIYKPGNEYRDGSRAENTLKGKTIQGPIMGNVGKVNQFFNSAPEGKTGPDRSPRATVSHSHAGGNIVQHFGDTIHINSGGDVAFAKDQAKASVKKAPDEQKPESKGDKPYSD